MISGEVLYHLAWPALAGVGAWVAANAATISAVTGAASAAGSLGLGIANAAKKPPTGPDPQKLIQKRTNAAQAITSGGLRTTLLTPAAGLQGAAPVQRATLLGQ